MRRMRLGMVATMLATIGFGATTAWADDAPLSVRVQSTTDTVDAGLYAGLIQKAYAAKYPNDTLSYTPVGTGAALTNARNGLADAVVTHAPTSEAQFVKDGYSVEPYGRAIFYSDYVIVGPKGDPAGVASSTPHDAIGAFERIAAAGAAGTAQFFSRADASGTNVQEQIMWGLTTGVPKQGATTAKPAATQYEPVGAGSAGTFPAWYSRVVAGQGVNVDNTSKCVAQSGDCYTMTDRGTFNNKINAGLDTNLVVLADKNSPGARGGENLLVNPFSVYIVNPDRFADGSKPNVAAGTRFADFLTSQDFQAAVNTFPTASDPAFFADAFPSVQSTLPTTAKAGDAVSMAVTFTDKLPGLQKVAGLPVTLQASTDGGNSFSDVGSATTDPNGTATFSAGINTTTTYRVSLPRYQKFSPFSQTLGVVAVPLVAAPITSSTPPKPVDKTAPKLTKAALTGRTVTLTTTEASRISVVIARKTTKRVKIKGSKKTRSKTTYPTVKRVALVAKGPGVVSTKFANLKPATYKLTITSTDASGNTSKQVVSLVLKAKKSASKKLG